MFWYFSWALELVAHQSWCSESLSILVTSTVTSSWLGFNSAPVGLLHASTMAGELSVPHLGPWPKCWWRFEETVWGGTFFGFVVPLHDQNLILQYFTIHLSPDYQSRSPSRLSAVLCLASARRMSVNPKNIQMLDQIKILEVPRVMGFFRIGSTCPKPSRSTAAF